MINQWLCDCGKNHSLSERYCDNCGGSIPDSVVEEIIREETQGFLSWIKWWFANLKKKRYEKKYGLKICKKCMRRYTGSTKNYCQICGSALQLAVTPVQKESIVAGVLGILIGFLGVQNFYLGYVEIGIVQVVIVLLSIFTGWDIFTIFGIISALGSFIQGVLILTKTIKSDAYGINLK